MTDPDETQAGPDLNDPTKQSSELPPDEGAALERALTCSQEDAEDNRHRRSVRLRIKQLAAGFLLLAVCLGGTVSALLASARQPPRPVVQPPVKGPIDGTYRIDRNRANSTTRTPDGKIANPATDDSAMETEQWAFQSACPPSSCVAVGTRLDNGTGTEARLRLVNGQWVSDPPYRVSHDCAAGTPGHDMWRVTVELTKLADGTLKGQETDLIESNDCGRAGAVATRPIVATRVGDLPAGLPPLKTK